MHRTIILLCTICFTISHNFLAIQDSSPKMLIVCNNFHDVVLTCSLAFPKPYSVVNRFTNTTQSLQGMLPELYQLVQALFQMQFHLWQHFTTLSTNADEIVSIHAWNNQKTADVCLTPDWHNICERQPKITLSSRLMPSVFPFCSSCTIWGGMCE